MPHRAANPDELFDVVDRDDRVIAQAPRREVHARALLHRAVHVMIHDREGRLFLQQRSPLKDTFPGCWDSSCSGHVDAGEDYVAAARRELDEELGWHDPSRALRPVVKLPASPETGHEFIEIFLLGPVEGPFTLHPDEITAGRWIIPADLDRELRESPQIFAGALRHLWANHREKMMALITHPISDPSS
jgi:isopentenyl-diphosphate delta-isomerase type 1